MINGNVSEKVQEFIASEQAFSLMNSVKGTSAYVIKILFDVLVMVKQLEIPKFFITFSSNDLKWNELISIINDLHKLDIEKILRIQLIITDVASQILIQFLPQGISSTE